GPIVAVTAGWEEREAEDDELREHLGRPLTNLAVWARVERILAADPELFEALRRRHDRLRVIQELYRLRLDGLLEPLRELHRRDDAPELIEPEQKAAMAMLRGLDKEHMERVAAVHRDFEARWVPGERDAVRRERLELQRLLGDAKGLLIAGGHVGVLLHRLRLFDLFGMLGDRPVVAWSAGAMILCPRIVLFHGSPPQGSHHPEVMEAGFGLVPGFVALPDARRRLQLDDARSMQVFARRMLPAHCGLLDRGAWFQWRDGEWTADPGSLVLDAAGVPQEVTT
ncbi:MAG: hypothetical protein KDC98_04360, partial [Planctomycetes bacterium]|nr:hypothetical protein [Planctomycetota bacterium]